MMNKKSNSFKDTFDTWYSKNNILIERTLFSYLSIKTVSPHEYLASDFLEVYLSSIGIDVTRSYFDNQKLLNNSKFTDHPQIDSSMKRFNSPPFEIIEPFYILKIIECYFTYYSFI